MLDELGSYALSDFLLFSEETYFRLFEMYNREIWPLHLLFLAMGAAAFYLSRLRSDEGARAFSSRWSRSWRQAARARPWTRRRTGRGYDRLAWLLIALLWGWIAWAFHLERYATINPAAPFFAALFGVEAVLLVVVGAIAGRLRSVRPSAAATAVVAYAVFVHPLTGFVAGRTWTELAFFGAAPDPTAIATIGLVLCVRSRFRWLLVLPAVAWLVVSALTYYAMGSVEVVPPVFFAAAALLLSLRGRNDSREGDDAGAKGGFHDADAHTTPAEPS